jgi:cellulose synthase/poly-beta-1,6-N-acetylglucosamine synthase-like glycosyltransferase
LYSEIVLVVWLVAAISLFVCVVWILVILENSRYIKKAVKTKSFPSTSIVIPAHNEEKNIRRVIESVLKLRYHGKIETIVVNDGSTDDTRKIAEEYAKKGSIILVNQRKSGKGAALNNVLKIAKGELFAVLDADSIVGSNALVKLVGHFEDEKTGAVISAIKPMNPRNVLEKLQTVEYIFACLMRRLMSLTGTNYITPGVFSIYRTDIIRKIGRFDEHNITEDMEIALRIRYHGYDIKNSIDAVSKTKLPDSFKKFYKQRMRWYVGSIRNTIKYRKMIMNKKYGYLGSFQLPLSLIFPIISFVIIFFFFFSAFDVIYNFALSIYLVGLQPPNFYFFSFMRMLLNLDFRIYFPLLTGLFSAIFFMFYSYKYTGEKVENKATIALFFIIYYTIINFLWFFAIIESLRGGKREW